MFDQDHQSRFKNVARSALRSLSIVFALIAVVMFRLVAVWAIVDVRPTADTLSAVAWAAAKVFVAMLFVALPLFFSLLLWDTLKVGVDLWGESTKDVICKLRLTPSTRRRFCVFWPSCLQSSQWRCSYS